MKSIITAIMLFGVLLGVGACENSAAGSHHKKLQKMNDKDLNQEETIQLSMTLEEKGSLFNQEVNVEYLGRELLEKVMLGGSTEELQTQLATLSVDDLLNALDTDNKKKAFWINIYNAYIIILLREDASLYENRADFFSTPRFTIANQELSFDDIEHGIIRKSRIKLSLGYLSNWFPGEFEKAARVQRIDYRIHFALNCGATSCPPVRVLHADKIDQELDENTRSYLTAFTTYDQEANELTVTPLMSWFRADFGGKSGTRKIVENLGITPKEEMPSIKYGAYDWSIDIDNFYQPSQETPRESF